MRALGPLALCASALGDLCGSAAKKAPPEPPSVLVHNRGVTVPTTKTGVQALLGAHGFNPTKLRGQHFLVDRNLIDAIVRDSGVGPNDCVLEIGTGTGILTDALAARAGRVVSCDLDARLQGIAKGLREWP